MFSSATGTRKYVATEPPVEAYRTTSTTSILKSQRHDKWRVFSVTGCSRSCTLVLHTVKTRCPRPPAAQNKPHRHLPAPPRLAAGTERCICTLGDSAPPGWCREAQFERSGASWKAFGGASEGVLSGDFVGIGP